MQALGIYCVLSSYEEVGSFVRMTEPTKESVYLEGPWTSRQKSWRKEPVYVTSPVLRELNLKSGE